MFLEAVGITKDDFEILNKYHIFQENVLNNYIHQFFVNESMGSKLNLEDEEVKRQYRNSFDWFGFGMESGVEPEVTIPYTGRAFTDSVRYQINEINKVSTKKSDKSNLIASLESNDTASEKKEEISDLDKIKEILISEKRGMKAGKIADLLGISKKEVNSILEENKDLFLRGLFGNWRLK